MAEKIKKSMKLWDYGNKLWDRAEKIKELAHKAWNEADALEKKGK